MVTTVGRQHSVPTSSFVPLHATDAATAAASNNKVTTGPDGKAALNYEDDLRLTLQIIMDHQQRSTTVSTEQLVQQVTAAAAITSTDTPSIDLSIPYHAAAHLAYDQESSQVKSTTNRAEYIKQYEAKAVLDVIAKKEQKVGILETATAPSTSTSSYDISIPYDAAAKLAYNALSSEERLQMNYDTFQPQYVAKAVADVVAKRASKAQTTSPTTTAPTPPTVAVVVPTKPEDDYNSNISIPYDAAARLAYSKLDTIKHSLTYETFQKQYITNTVQNVMVKKRQRDAALSKE
jgi:hypothetical protein